MSWMNRSIVELNRRLLGTPKRADFEDTINSKWYNDVISSSDFTSVLRFQARTCRIACLLYAKKPSEKLARAKQQAFSTLANTSAKILCHGNMGRNQRHLASILFANVLKEAATNPALLKDAVDAYTTHSGYRSVLYGQVQTEIGANIREASNYFGWDNQTRFHMLAVARLATQAPTAILRDMFAMRALLAASASISACSRMLSLAEPDGHMENLLKSQREFGGKSLVELISADTGKAAKIVFSAYAGDESDPNAERALRIKSNANDLLNRAMPKVTKMQTVMAQRRANLDAFLDPMRNMASILERAVNKAIALARS